jgi:hypothetical protein
MTETMTRALPQTLSLMTKKRRSAKTTKTNQMPKKPTPMTPNDLSVPTICAGDLSGFRSEQAAANQASITRFTLL